MSSFEIPGKKTTVFHWTQFILFLNNKYETTDSVLLVDVRQTLCSKTEVRQRAKYTDKSEGCFYHLTVNIGSLPTAAVWQTDSKPGHTLHQRSTASRSRKLFTTKSTSNDTIHLHLQCNCSRTSTYSPHTQGATSADIRPQGITGIWLLQTNNSGVRSGKYFRYLTWLWPVSFYCLKLRQRGKHGYMFDRIRMFIHIWTSLQLIEIYSRVSSNIRASKTPNKDSF